VVVSVRRTSGRTKGSKPKAGKVTLRKPESDKALAEERDRMLSLPEAARGSWRPSNDMLYKTTAPVYNASDEPLKVSVGGLEYEIPPGESDQPFIVARYLENYSMSPVHGSFIVPLHLLEGDEKKETTARADVAFMHHTANFVQNTLTARAERVRPFRESKLAEPPMTEQEARAVKLSKKFKGKLVAPSFNA
jgi:hypothetical protein